MSRPGHDAVSKLDARTAALRRAVLKAERTLVRETKKREIPCHCQSPDSEYIYTYADFLEVRELYEKTMAHWRIDLQEKGPQEKGNGKKLESENLKIRLLEGPSHEQEYEQEHEQKHYM